MTDLLFIHLMFLSLFAGIGLVVVGVVWGFISDTLWERKISRIQAARNTLKSN